MTELEAVESSEVAVEAQPEAPAIQPLAETLKQYKRHWDGFALWCQQRSYQAIPATYEKVFAYLLDLLRSGRRPKTATMVATAINYVHREAGHASPSPSSRQLLDELTKQVPEAFGIKKPVPKQRKKTIPKSKAAKVKSKPEPEPIDFDKLLRRADEAREQVITTARTHAHSLLTNFNKIADEIVRVRDIIADTGDVSLVRAIQIEAHIILKRFGPIPSASVQPRLARRNSEKIAAELNRVIELLKESSGMRAEIIQQKLNLDRREMPRILREGLQQKKLCKRGHKRATVYSIQSVSTSKRSGWSAWKAKQQETLLGKPLGER